MSMKNYTILTGIIFGLVSLMHLLRVILSVDVFIGTWPTPEWISWFGFIGSGFFSFWAFKLARN
ncbi:MAG: hypothetical protein DWQ10_10935 [Calditrichaeota bacterium]|nr:MAG: hypothetical protein DWQ10_10935 [Calditrichota bacterium]